MSASSRHHKSKAGISIANLSIKSVNNHVAGTSPKTPEMQGLLKNDDEVLIPAPDYPLWTAAVNLAGGKAVHYICDEQSEWYPDLKDIKSKITTKTKGIVIINPNNPTGSVYPEPIL